MKKFLSLVLALVMTMSLVTIGAGATEYKDLTDKSGIQYEEAVAVLNKLGIITGYEDGSFKPTGALTRGAAAKIIVSLMIGSEAASNLTVSAAPYKDVATTNTFAAVISYCKTAGYISGYTDGTFRPTGALTGYAFSKMLLGALGYDGTVEGFTGSGWTMNVAKLGNVAGLFNDFATAFKGNDGVTREAACLLALNTLKATEVEYTGNTVNVSGKDISVSVGNNKYESVVNNSNTDGNIPGNSAVKDGYMQFAEEHFSDLKLTNGAQSDSFGRPSNQWNYKGVEIGKYAKTADYTYTTTASGDTAADKVKSMGIKDFTLGGNATTPTGTVTPVINGKNGTAVTALTDIPGLLGKGTQVMLYTSDDVANRITDIVVIQTQVMQVKKVNSDNVTLKTIETSDPSARLNVAVNTVNDDDSAYATLKGLKADDFVVVTPVATSSAGTSYDVDSVYVPTTVTGNISKVSLDSGAVNGVTVSGTDYKLSKNWTVKDGRSNLGTSSVSTKVQSTIYLDAFGFMIYATDVSASSDYIIFDETYSNVVDGRIHYFAQGYDMNGNALSLDMGTSASVNTGLFAGDLMKYTTNGAPDNADYKWTTGTREAIANTTIAAGSYNFNGLPFASDVKFIFLTGNGILNTATGDVTGVTVKDGVQKVTTATNIAYTTNDAGTEIKAVVVSGDSDVEVSQNIMYISEVTGQSKDSSGKNVSVFTGYIDGTETKNLVANKIVGIGFYTYAEKDGIYSVNAYSPSASSANYVNNSASLRVADIASKNYITMLDGAYPLGAGQALDARNATVIDLKTNDGVTYSSIKDLAESGLTSFQIAIQYNASTTSSRGQVAYIYVLANAATTNYYDLTVANTDTVEYSLTASPFTALAAGTQVVSGTIYARSKTALQKVVGVAGATVAAAPVTAPTAALDQPVYAVTVTGNVAGSAITATTNWFTVATPTNTTTTPVNGITVASIVADKAVVEVGASVTYTVTYSGTAAGASTITFTAPTTGVTAPGTLTVAIADTTVVAAGTTATFTCTAATAAVDAASVNIA